jgi:hypothetical protein
MEVDHVCSQCLSTPETKHAERVHADFRKRSHSHAAEAEGFRDEIAFAVPGGLDVVAISLWDTKEYAEAYKTAGYPEVLKILNKVLDGTPKVQVSDVISSTIHKPAAVAA